VIRIVTASFKVEVHPFDPFSKPCCNCFDKFDVGVYILHETTSYPDQSDSNTFAGFPLASF